MYHTSFKMTLYWRRAYVDSDGDNGIYSDSVINSNSDFETD